MASSYFFIQDRTNADRKFKNLQHQLWDHFLEYLRSGSPSLLLSQYLGQYEIALPAGTKFSSNSQLAVIPTPTGLRVYIPGKGDFFFREEMIDGKRPPFMNNGLLPKYGLADITGHHNGKSSMSHPWVAIFPAIEKICSRVISDVQYFENIDITDPANVDFKLEYAACEIQWLLSCSRFYLACCANSRNITGLSIPNYQYAMTEMSVIGLVLYKSKHVATLSQVQRWLESCPQPFEIANPSANDCGGLITFTSVFGLQIETKNRGGMRIPGERRTKFVKSEFAGLHISSKTLSSSSSPIVSNGVKVVNNRVPLVQKIAANMTITDGEEDEDLE